MLCFPYATLGIADLVVGHLTQALIADIHDQQKAFGELAILLLGTIFAVVITLPCAIFGTPTVFDVIGHARLTMFGGLRRVICRPVICDLLRLQRREILRSVSRVIGRLLGDKLLFGLAMAPAEPRTDPIAIQV